MRACRSTASPRKPWRATTCVRRACSSSPRMPPAAHLSLTLPRAARIDRLGALLTAAAALALWLLPFVFFKSNRILPGEPHTLGEVLPRWGALGCTVALVLAAYAAIAAADARLRLGAALIGIVAVALAAAA